MPKGSEELTSARKEEILDACARLYETMSFQEITVKEIGSATSFTRTSIYNYYRTKEEIFLALLQREFEAWNGSLRAALSGRESLSRGELAELLADTLTGRERMLRILSLNMYDIEENSRLERLVEFKKAFGGSLAAVDDGLRRAVPAMSEEERRRFLYSFFPLVYGVYPYTHATAKQKAAMERAGVPFQTFSPREMTLMAARKLLEA